MYDLIVVGGGPAGLTATIYAIRKRLNVLLVSRDLGGKTQYHLSLPWIEDYQVIRGLEVVNKFKSELEYLDFARHMEPEIKSPPTPMDILSSPAALSLGVGTYKGVEVMETTQFCGAACHTVMEPEYTTYKRSPHARVKCVECHIGEGADWFVKSKLSGSWQLVSVTFDLYSKPIEVPVHNLRPARETCEQCHWPNKFVGDRFRVNTHFSEDEANTETKTVLVVKVGGRQAGRSQGIHWHVDPDHVVRYRSDAKRQKIYEVEVETKDGKKERFAGPAASSPEAVGVKLVNLIYETAPGVLTKHGKTKNPSPNVDAHSGVIQWYYGVREWDFYTVLFGVGRALGVLANITWDRGLGYAIERPKSLTTDMLEQWAKDGGRKGAED